MQRHRTDRADAGDRHQPLHVRARPGPGTDLLLKAGDLLTESGNLLEQQFGHRHDLFGKRMWTPPAVQEGFRTTCRHAVRYCRMSGLSNAAFTRCGPIWGSWIGAKSHRRYAKQPCVLCWFSRPRLSDLLPLCCLSSQPHHPGLSAHHALKTVSAEPGIPIPNSPLLFQAAIPQQRQSPPAPGRFPS